MESYRFCYSRAIRQVTALRRIEPALRISKLLPKYSPPIDTGTKYTPPNLEMDSVRENIYNAESAIHSAIGAMLALILQLSSW